MTYPELCAHLRRVIAQAPGRVLALKVTPEQMRVLQGPHHLSEFGPTPMFCDVPLQVRL